MIELTEFFDEDLSHRSGKISFRGEVVPFTKLPKLGCAPEDIDEAMKLDALQTMAYLAGVEIDQLMVSRNIVSGMRKVKEGLNTLEFDCRLFSARSTHPRMINAHNSLRVLAVKEDDRIRHFEGIHGNFLHGGSWFVLIGREPFKSDQRIVDMEPHEVANFVQTMMAWKTQNIEVLQARQFTLTQYAISAIGALKDVTLKRINEGKLDIEVKGICPQKVADGMREQNIEVSPLTVGNCVRLHLSSYHEAQHIDTLLIKLLHFQKSRRANGLVRSAHSWR